jgi:hypothetical protein
LKEDYHKLIQQLNAKRKDAKHEETKAPEAPKKDVKATDKNAKPTATTTKVDPKKAPVATGKPVTAPTKAPVTAPTKAPVTTAKTGKK